MSGKLDQSLDEIVSSHRRSGASRGRGRRARPSRQASKAVAPPVGGVKKGTKPVKGAKPIPTGPSSGFTGSKIQVSSLPKDVNESQIKEYFGQSVGPIKKVEIAYGPGGVSRGVATITFARPDGASKAVQALNGLLVDNKPMRIDVIVDASKAKDLPTPKGLSERVAQPKAQPKSAAPKAATNSGTAARGRGKRARGGRNPGRPSKKTAEELDSEMVDYWNTGATATEGEGAGSTAQPAANGDAPMEDEIL